MGIKHGLSKTRLYRIWNLMKFRCYNNKSKNFKHYGGRGIYICDEWKNDFLSFYNWSMDNGYNDMLTIDRIDNNGSYTPENCRWTTIREQSRNRSNNRLLKYKGFTRCLIDWSSLTGINYSTLGARLRRGDNIENALETQVEGNRLITFNGETKTLTEWSEQTGIKICTLWGRLEKGWTVEEALTIPAKRKKRFYCHSKKMITYKGVSKTLAGWSRETGISYGTLYNRLKNGQSIEDALENPIKSSFLITYKGITKSLVDWSREKGIPPRTVRYRLQRGWSVEKALETNGREKTL